MSKNILITLVLVFLTACSQNTPEPKTETAKAPTVEPVNVPIAENTIPTDFVPEHIRRSNIEVVERY